MLITVIDYKCGNLGSIQNMIRKIGYDSVLTSDPKVVLKSDRIILPGVGSFDYGMQKLDELGLVDIIKDAVLEKKTPILGVCLGAQLLCQKSEEGILPGLGLVKGEVKRFPHMVDGIKKTVPHMGWDEVKPVKKSPLFDNLVDPRFYFVHSYYINCQNSEDVLSVNSYGIVYHSAFERGNIIGAQFHPEKSHRFGKQLYKNFIDLY